jgi:aspergillopepsin I
LLTVSSRWVFSTEQPEDQIKKRKVSRIYDPKGSNAINLTDHSWAIKYGDMSKAEGHVYLDKVSIGGLTVEKQAVGAATSVSGSFVIDLNNDGLIGLGQSRLNTIRPKSQLTWFDNVRPQLRDPVFTASLKRRAAGTYDFGFIDKSKYRGDIIWAPVKGAKGFWDFETSGFSIGDGPMQPKVIDAIVDTGTSLWYMPRDVVSKYYANVPGAEREQTGRDEYIWKIPCNRTQPDIGIWIGDQKIVVPGENIEYQSMSIKVCFGGMQENASNMPFSIFGDCFMKGLMVAFEAPENKPHRMGFAQQSESYAFVPPKDAVPQLLPGIGGGGQSDPNDVAPATPFEIFG